MSAERPLTDKQEAFCREYLIDLCGAAAARRAGYSVESAGVIASQLLDETKIWVRIAERMEERNKRCEVTADDVVRLLKRIAFGDTRRIATWGPGGVRLRESDDLTDDDAPMVAEVSESNTQFGRTLKFKRNDQLRAAELLGKHLGMFREGGVPTDDAPEPKQIVFNVVDSSEPADDDAAPGADDA